MILHIFGKKIRVLKKHGMMDDGIRGLYISDKKLILIDSDLVGPEYMQTLIHEIVHAVIDRTGLDQAKISYDAEEMLCENIATALIENFSIKKK